MLKERSFQCFTTLLVSALWVAPRLHASVIQISNLADPIFGGATYQSGTAKIGSFSGLPDLTTVSSITDGTLIVGFFNAVTKATVPATFPTWGLPPDTESPTPAVLNTFANPNPSVRTLAFSKPIEVFGVEVEGGDFDAAGFTMNFFSGATLLGSISRTVVGDGSARVLAGESGVPFDSVVITNHLASGDNSFAMAEVRYSFAAVPEPNSVFLLGGGFGLLLGAARLGKTYPRVAKT
jgi:hypothetical protein